MSTKHIDSAADLVRFGAALRIECTGCGAASTFSATEIAQRCGVGSLEAIRRRLKCHRCGMKAAQLVVLPPI